MKLAHRPDAAAPASRENERGDGQRARRETWGLVGVGLALFGFARWLLGPLPQEPAYHLLADTRTLGPVPRAGDVLTNAAILAAGIAGLWLWKRVRISPDERPVYGLFVLATLATALGSAWYHALPDDARLVWDRLPLTLVLASVFVLVLADRVDPAFARVAWWPFTLFGAASVAWWAWTDRDGSGGDLLLYVVVRAGAALGIVYLLLFRRGRHTHARWLAAAVALDIAMTVCEALDRQIFAATGSLISGHNAKHLLAGALLGCILAWLTLREARVPA